MLKELNNIAIGLLGLHGYPVRTVSAPAAASTEAPADTRNEGGAAASEGGDKGCRATPRPHSRPTFAW